MTNNDIIISDYIFQQKQKIFEDKILKDIKQAIA
jgi:hypothetical protein